MKDWTMAKDTETVCFCQNVDKQTIVASIHRGNITLNSIQAETTACTGGDCTVHNPSGKCCSADIMELVKIYSGEEESSSSCCSCGP